MNISFSKEKSLPDILIPGRVYFTEEGIHIATSETVADSYVSKSAQYDDTWIRNKIDQLESELEASKHGFAYVSENKLIFKSSSSATIVDNKLIL